MDSRETVLADELAAVVKQSKIGTHDCAMIITRKLSNGEQYVIQTKTDYAAAKSLRQPTPDATIAAHDGLVEALRAAQPIVEADYYAAKDTSDSDWIGQSKEALDKIKAALASIEAKQ